MRSNAERDEITLFDSMAAELYVAVISDVLDSLGFRDQVMGAGIHSVWRADARPLVGRAATMQVAPVYEVTAEPYTAQIAAIDALGLGDIAVIGASGTHETAVWGELFSNAAVARGARGVITDGFHRDTRMLHGLEFTIYSRGARPVDLSGRGVVVSAGRPVDCGGVRVRPGDILFAEIDGIAVIPAAVREEALQRAFAKVATENLARQELREGAYLGDVWRRHRVL